MRLIGWSQDDKELILATLKSRASSTRPTEVELVRVSAATGEQRSIATLQSAYLYNIHLSADRRTIGFTSRQDGKDNIWLIPASGGEAKKLTANNDARLYFSSLSWSPDGRRVVYVRSGTTSGRWEMWVSEVNDSPVTHFIGYGMMPRWSPERARN